MSRCTYCRCQLPPFETLCQKCFEGRAYQLDHPVPWWHFRWLLAPRYAWVRPRFRRYTMYIFLFIFVDALLRFRLGITHPPAIKTCIGLALIFACLEAFLGSSIEDRKLDSQKIGAGGIRRLSEKNSRDAV